MEGWGGGLGTTQDLYKCVINPFVHSVNPHGYQHSYYHSIVFLSLLTYLNTNTKNTLITLITQVAGWFGTILLKGGNISFLLSSG